MEVMGGAPFMDGDWESICKILSFDQDSEIGLLMGNSNPSTSQCELDFPFNHTNQLLPTPFSNNLFQLSCGSDLSNGFNHGSLINDDDQISSLTSSSSLGNHSMKRKHDDQAEIPASKKRACSTNNRKMIKSRNDKDEEEQKPSSDTSDNESNGSHTVINEEAKETPKLNGKRRANRGAATDPQSLYARKRRERINERLRILQNLVPNGTKVDISTMLEEAVSYVKFLQMQIKLLSSNDMWMYAPLAYNGFDVGV